MCWSLLTCFLQQLVHNPGVHRTTHHTHLCCAVPQASFALAGGVLPTLNLDKLPVPLPDVVLLG